MNQKIDHFKEGDLVIVTIGWNKRNISARFISAKVENNIVISITYKPLNSDARFHIRTRHSEYQRVYKITEDNL